MEYAKPTILSDQNVPVNSLTKKSPQLFTDHMIFIMLNK